MRRRDVLTTLRRLALTLVVALGWALRSSPVGAAPSLAGQVREGNATLDDWQVEDAKAAAERLLVAAPDEPSVWLLAARVQHARGEHLAALSLADAARDAGEQEALAVLPLIEASAPYGAHFATLETPHFRVRYLNKDEIVARYAAPVLEAAYARIGAALEFLVAERGEKVVVEIYPDARGLAGATGLTIKEIETSGTIAVCKFHRLMITSPLATADGYGWADTLAHEFTHLVISKKSHNTVPIWLHEGIAKYFESTWRGEPGGALAPYSEKLLADAVRTHKFVTYQQMHPSMAKLASQDEAALAFAEVFTTIEYIVREHGRTAVPRLLDLLAGGTSMDQALRKVTGKTLAELERAWHKYLATRPFREVAGAKPKPIRLASNESKGDEARPLEDMKDREAHDRARLGELLQLRGHHAAAVVEYEKAYARAGVAYASLAYRLARAYADTKRDSEALGVLDKALIAFPDDNDCHLLAGRLRLAQRDLAGATREFEAVRLENPFNPEVHAALRALYEARGDAAAAAEEARFFELAKQPRPTRQYELPPPRAGSARLDLICAPFADVQLDGRDTFAAPYFGIAVEPGEHRLTLGGANTSEKKVTVSAGQSLRVLVSRP